MIEADLTGRAGLNIPWAGWTKGPGIAANVSFMLENSDGKSTLSDFNLSGDELRHRRLGRTCRTAASRRRSSAG